MQRGGRGSASLYQGHRGWHGTMSPALALCFLPVAGAREVVGPGLLGGLLAVPVEIEAKSTFLPGTSARGVCSRLKWHCQRAPGLWGAWTWPPGPGLCSHHLAPSLPPSLLSPRLCAPGPRAHAEPGGGPRLHPGVPREPRVSRALLHSPKDSERGACWTLLTEAV